MKNILALIFSLALALTATAKVTSTPSRGIRENIQNIRTEAKQEIQGIRQTMQEQVKSASEDFQKTMEAKRAELKAAIKTHRDALKAKLQKIKDKGKKAAVERIDQNLTDLNSRMTAHFENVLNQIDKVLDKVISRTDKAQTKSLDVAVVRTAITNAQNAITVARTAVTTQVSKIYSMNITNDKTLKNDVGVARQALHDDLKKVSDAVKAARDTVRQAAVSLAQIQGVDEESTSVSTTSTNQ